MAHPPECVAACAFSIGLRLVEHIKLLESEAKSRWQAGPLNLI